jgi:hypothetical protein
MIKGHLDQTRRNQRSTQQPDNNVECPDAFPTSDPTGKRSNIIYAATFAPTGKIYTDQTGKFIAPSSHGNNYIMILYDYDSNAILAAPMKTRTGKSILDAFQQLYTRLVHAGH